MSCDTPALTAVVAGLSYDLNDGVEIRLLDYDLGLAAVRRLSQRYPGQFGDTDLGFVVEPRFADIAWIVKGTTLSNYRDIRARVLEVFQPRDNDPVKLTFDFGDRVRCIDVSLDGELNWDNRVETVERVSGVFKAPDPRLYDPSLHTVLFNLAASGAGAGWAVPWAIPWVIGTDVLNLTVDILYSGGSRLGAVEFPVIRIFGPIDGPVISNLTTGEVIDLTDGGGLSLSTTSDWVEIDLANPPRRDAKTIVDETGASVEQYMTPESDFATWHLAPAGERLFDDSYATGHNLINITGINVTSQTLVSVRYYDRYVAA